MTHIKAANRKHLESLKKDYISIGYKIDYERQDGKVLILAKSQTDFIVIEF